VIARLIPLFVAAFLGCDAALGSHPRDAELLERFRTHRAELEQLVRMFQEDAGLGRVGATFTRPEDPGRVGVTEQRIAEYRRLCAAVGAPDCIEGYDAAYDRLYEAKSSRAEAKDPIWVPVSSQGLAVSGSSKGFVYSTNPSFPVVDDLDRVTPTRSGTWLRRIEGPWHLYYDFED